MTQRIKPELLAPAGSPDSLRAAISAGADAVYMGLSRFNARARAENFGHDELLEAVKLCRLYGRKLYIALNTLVYDKEFCEVLSEAKFCAEAGVDAFIVQDLGLMRALRAILPEVPIHASTQCATHNLEQIKALASLGVSRVVVARELTRGDLEKITSKSPVDVEAFVHGALCMSHSGTCLMSAYLGGRSGNRGECAQPCRLPYRLEKSSLSHPLSLKDLSLCTHVRELCQMGIASFKIEGRMKSPEYVYKTVSVFRRLIDEGRDARPDEVRELEGIFSRDGFTDGYYTLKKGKEMFGTRTALDKMKTRATEKGVGFELDKIPISAVFTKNGSLARLVFTKGSVSGEAECEALAAEGGGTGEAVIKESILKLGDTPFACDNVKIELDSPAFFKRSSLNALRREAAEKLEAALAGEKRIIPHRTLPELFEKRFEGSGLWVIFAVGKVKHSVIEALFQRGVERVFLPLNFCDACPDPRCGVVLPRAVFEKDEAEFSRWLDSARLKGYKMALAENLGVGKIAEKHGFSLVGGAGLNAVNSHSVTVLSELGFEAVLLSGEVVDSAKRSLKAPIPKGDVVWGRAPLMLIENCVMGTRDSCFGCGEHCSKRGELEDRTGEKFPVFPDAFHRAVIYNSRPTYRGDADAIEGMSFRAVYITDETDAEAIVEKVLKKSAPDFKFTRK